MKKAVILAAIVGVFSISTTYAQTNEAPKKEKTESAEKRGGGNRNAMADLNLNPDQQAKMKAVNDDGRAKMEAVRNDASLNDDQKKAKIAEIRKDQNEKRNAILTPEQRTKWEARMKEMREKRDAKPQQQ